MIAKNRYKRKHRSLLSLRALLPFFLIPLPPIPSRFFLLCYIGHQRSSAFVRMVHCFSLFVDAGVRLRFSKKGRGARVCDVVVE